MPISVRMAVRADASFIVLERMGDPSGAEL